MLPPPRLPTVTSEAPGPPTDCQGAWYGGRALPGIFLSVHLLIKYCQVSLMQTVHLVIVTRILRL